MKLGLGLSGGGYRAANMHLGVLEEMHNQDILRYVDVISTVSGGSIIGSYWVYHYAENYKLASEGNRDSLFIDFKRDFIDRVLKVNLVSKILWRCGRPTKLFRLLSNDYSRTDVAVDVYEEILKFNDSPDDGFLWGLPESPKLIVNATNLNNGQIWKFTKSKIGDRDNIIDNQRFINTYRLAKAVAASAAFPGGFPPIELERDKYFKDKNGEIKLSDGGIKDNLGISSLVVEGCDYIIISDAGSPFKDKKRVAGDEVNTLLRVIDVFQDEARSFSISKLKGKVEGFLNNNGIKGSVVLEIDDIFHKNDTEWPPDRVDVVSNVETNLQALDGNTINLLIERGVYLAKNKISKYMSNLKDIVEENK
jgi:predicted acylesterase/phospholipase RssA